MLFGSKNNLRSDFKDMHSLESVKIGDMSYCLLPINVPFHDTILEHPNRLQDVQSTRITRINSVKNKADYDFLPCGCINIPKRGRLLITDRSNIFHDPVKSTRCQYLVFLFALAWSDSLQYVVVSNCNKQFCLTIVNGLTERISIFSGKIIRIACSCGV